MYHRMFGHPFGIGPAVTNYNRGAEFSMHITRIIFGIMCLHFYDDALLLGFSHEQGSAQYCYTQLQKLLGTLLDPKKAQRMSTNPGYIGVILELSRLLSHGEFTILPKEGRVDTILASIRAVQEADWITPSAAAEFMGKLNFLGSQVAGRLLRGCLGPLGKHAHLSAPSQLTPPSRTR